MGEAGLSRFPGQLRQPARRGFRNPSLKLLTEFHAAYDGGRNPRGGPGPLGPPAEVTLGLDGHDLLDGGRVVEKVRTLSGPDLYHAARKTIQELAAVPVRPAPLGDRRE